MTAAGDAPRARPALSRSPLARGVQGARYAAAQMARIAWFTGHYIAGRRFMGPLTRPGEAPYAEEFGPLDRERLKTSFRELFRADWRNIERGEYKLPREARRAPSLKRLLTQSRDYFSDARAVARRRQARGHSEVLGEGRDGGLPRYYLQNFHYQTDGWLSESSAERYDMQVETLFTGAAGAMRRQALPAIRRAIGDRDTARLSFLDLGCGTGGFLEEVKDNWPLLHATALDLSPAYLGAARRRLAGARAMRYLEANAEETGLPDASVDIVAAVYLFHELPPAVRKSVAREIARILKPGGALIEVDTIQYGDEPGLDILLENFPRAFHEPYYDSYCRTDLATLFSEAGLKRKDEAIAFLTKVCVFEKR
ncbi:MAG: methyltransferase domain-containing protein [Alphaproteobacteria bacterium]|nr:methyltransferase domain-containing protein [Alphaproteobacteria bacterium]